MEKGMLGSLNLFFFPHSSLTTAQCITTVRTATWSTLLFQHSPCACIVRTLGCTWTVCTDLCVPS